MSSHLPFPLADFYDALVSNSLKEKLQPFIAQFKNKNIYIIFQCVNRLIQIINNKSQVPIMKFNALVATRIFFDTCQYAAIILIEVYLLPIIYQIALQKYLKRSEEGVQMYFIDRGAQNTKQIKRLGLNYVEMASQFIFNSARVKPYRLIQNKQLKQESNFSKVVKILKGKNIYQPQKCIYYIPSYQIQTRKKYLKKLKHLTPEPYISFFISEYLEEINLNKKCDLELKKILLFGDAYITSTMINIIQTQLDDMSHNFINKKKFVSLLNEMIRSGDIEAIILLNSSSFIAQITSNIGKVRGDISPNQGEFIYPKIEASKQQKKQFYLQFLRCLQIWAYSIPTSEEGDESDAKIAYDSLKQKNFVFPQNVILKKIKIQMQESLKVNQQRNQALMKIIQQDDTLSIRNSGSYLTDKGQFKFKFIKPSQDQQYFELEELQCKVFQAKRKIARLSIKKEQLESDMRELSIFKKNWDTFLDKLDIQDEDGHQLQILLQQGDLCCEQIRIIDSFYAPYKSKKISHQQFVQKIQLFLNSQDGDQAYSTNSKKKRAKKFQNLSKSSQVSISIDNDLKSQKKRKDSNLDSNDISLDGKQSLMSKNKERLNKVRGNQNKEQKIGRQQEPKNAENVKKIKEFKSSSQNDSKMSRLRQQVVKKPSLISVEKIQKKQSLEQKNNDLPVIQRQTVKNHLSNNSSSNLQSRKQSGAKSNQDKNHREKFQQCQVSLNKTSSVYSQQLQQKIDSLKGQKQKQKQNKKKISIIKHSVISKSSHKSQPTQQKIYFTGQQSHSLINQYEVQRNHINLKKSLMKRTQNLKGKLISKTSKQENLQSDSRSRPQQEQQLKSPFKKKKGSVLKASVLRKKQNYFDKYRKQDQNQSDQGYQKVFRTKNRSKIQINQSVISSDSQPEKVQYKRNGILAKNNKNEHLQYYNQDLNSQYLNQNQYKLKNLNSISIQNSNSLQNQKSPKKTSQVNKQYSINHMSPKIIKFNQKISQISKQTSQNQQRVKQSGVKLFSKSQEKSFDKMYNKLGNIFPSDHQNGSSMIQNQSYVQQYKIKTGNKFGSKQSSKQNFYQKQNKKLKRKQFTSSKQLKDNDLINQPEDFPMLNSYYSQKQFQRQYSKVDQYSDFRSCYANFQKQILPINQSQSKVVSKSFSMEKISNFIEYKQRSSKVSTMVDAISQKNAKNSILMYKLQRQKTRLIQNLQNKIKSLEDNGKFMRTKLAVKDQLKSQQSISVKQISQRQKFKGESQSIKIQNYIQSNISLYRQMQQKNKLNLQSKRQEASNEIHSQVNNLKCQLLNFNEYSGFFDFNCNKKNFLKKKGVLLKNQQIQIGFMINKKDRAVNFLLFITPLKNSLKNVCLSFQNNYNIVSSISPNKMDSIQLKKQQIANFKVNIQNIPFKTPVIAIKYCSYKDITQRNFTFQLPCSMLNFCEFHQNQSKSNKKELQGFLTVRTDMFKVNKKIFKAQKITQILPNFKLVKQNKKTCYYQGRIVYNQNQFQLTLIEDNSGLMSAQGNCKEQKNVKFLQFLLSTLRYLLSN